MSRPHVLHLVLAPHRGDMRSVVERFPMVANFAAALDAKKLRNTVLWSTDRASTLEREGVTLSTFPWRHRAERLFSAALRARSLGPDVVHLHGIATDHLLLAPMLRAALPRARVLLHDQRTRVPESYLGRRAMQLGFSAAHASLFAAREQAEPFLSLGWLRPSQVRLAPGGSSRMKPLPRAEALRALALPEDAFVYLWPHRVAEDKSALFAARGLCAAMLARPHARLLVAPLSAPLREPFLQLLAPVAERVRWLGAQPAERLPALYSAADVVPLCSPAEGYSFALVESLSCGASPVVSAIPPSLAAVGPVGQSFPLGDLEAFTRALLAPPTPREAVLAHFEERLSYDAMARACLAAYSLASSPAPR